jgi:hypothetical protein
MLLDLHLCLPNKVMHNRQGNTHTRILMTVMLQLNMTCMLSSCNRTAREESRLPIYSGVDQVKIFAKSVPDGVEPLRFIIFIFFTPVVVSAELGQAVYPHCL